MNRKYANIIVEISIEKLDRPFQYRIPASLQEFIKPGARVLVPFGNGNRTMKGYVLECTDQAEFDESRMKEILSVVTGQVTAEENAIRLASWIREQYGSTMIQAMKVVLPVKQKVRGIVQKTIVSIISKEAWGEVIAELKRKHQEARLRLAEELVQTKELPYELVTGKLGVSSSVLKAMQEKGWIKIEEVGQYRNPVMAAEASGELLTLSSEQQNIVDTVMNEYGKDFDGKYLIHGITGSGKTLVYIHLIKRMIALGKQAIVLIPEIALTYQTVIRFYQAFGNRVTIVNSKLSAGEKYDQFQRARNGEVDVVIGPRSALFVPFMELGIIIIDEEHEGSYKSESVPKYHARETAFELASYHHAAVVMGSATPSLEASYLCEKGMCRKFTLTKRLTGGTLPKVHIADLREELKHGNRTMFSTQLRELINDRLQKKEQIMLFLNRRGYAGFVSCRTCGTVMKCPHCDVSLSEHRNQTLVCHYCGYVTEKPSVCPKCGSKYVMGFKAGTQQIEEALWREFPFAKTLRMDGDTTKNKDSYEEILSAFSNHEADILVGTQMIVKGHDFPNVTLVGILAADISLHASDFRAGERTFELLTQAAGRAGRGTSPGEVVIQSYQPENEYIQYASRQDYDAFYQEEIEYRKLLGYPPVCHMLAIMVLAEQEPRCQKVLEEITGRVRQMDITQKQVSVIGPAPASVGKIKDIYRYVTYCKASEKTILVEIKNRIERFLNEIPRENEYIQFDFDPMNM